MKTKIIIALVLCVLAISCKNKADQNTEKDTGLIAISKAQFESERMTIGEPLLYPFADKLSFSGKIVPSVSGHAQISLPFPGIIENIRCKPAQMIQKGTVLFEISGHWFIDLQKDFSESSAILAKLKSEYQRAKDLFNENISTQKDFTVAESNFYAENAKYKALKTKLESMDLNVAKIEKGEFYKSYPIKSPIHGFVSSLNATTGQYIEPQQTIAEIIDNNSYQLKLYVFEKDIEKISIGQAVEFYLNASNAQKYQATINAIGKSIMPESKSIECYATISNHKSFNLVSNQYVEGEIITTLNSALAVPETAIMNSENDKFVLLFEKEEKAIFYFSKVKINTGRRANNYIELIGQIPLKKLLLTGTYNIVID